MAGSAYYHHGARYRIERMAGRLILEFMKVLHMRNRFVILFRLALIYSAILSSDIARAEQVDYERAEAIFAALSPSDQKKSSVEESFKRLVALKPTAKDTDELKLAYLLSLMKLQKSREAG